MTELTVASTLAARRSVGDAAHRPDIDGLRALAVGLVVAYHVWFGRVSGGVDVFLMISAYFLTASLARRLLDGRGPALGAYWVGRFRRLLPAAAVTIVGVLAVTWLWFPPSTWSDVWRQAWASLFYAQNWELMASSVDYYAREESTPSPLLHFWSLSIQGQVFIAWPLVILTIGLAARRAGLDLRRSLAVVFAVIFAASFVYSIIATSADQQRAYFDTFARLWEFALGSLLALAAPQIRLGARWAIVVGWAGIAGLVSCGMVLDVQGGFPGYLALWPTLSAAAVIIAGRTTTRFGAERFLSNGILLRLGAIAYALYLVHWPVLITWLTLTNRTSVGPYAGTAVIALSVGLAFALTYLVENPVRRSRWISASTRRGVVAILASVALVAVPLTAWTAAETARAATIEASSQNPGAAVLLPGGSGPDGSYDEIVPLATALDEEWVALDGPCTGTRKPVAGSSPGCSEKPAASAPQGTLVVVGDSHAQQWMGAVIPLAEERGLDVVALLKAGCSFAADESPVPGVEGCQEWRDDALAHIRRLDPAIIVAMGTKTIPDASEERLLAGIEATLEDLSTTEAQILLIRDNPRFAIDMFDCVEDFGPEAAECTRTADAVLAHRNPAAGLEGGDVRVADLTPYLCPDGVCLPVIGGVVVYLDDNHLTATYARTLAPALARLL